MQEVVYLPDINVRLMEGHQLNTPSLLTPPQYQARPPVPSPGCSDNRLGAHDGVLREVMAVHLVRDLCLCKQYQILFLELHGPDDLGEVNDLDIPYFVHPKVEPCTAVALDTCGFGRWHVG